MAGSKLPLPKKALWYDKAFKKYLRYAKNSLFAKTYPI